MTRRIACVQLVARDLEESEAALVEALDMARDAASRADLVVLPEATYPGYVLHDSAPLLERGSGWYEEALDAFARVALERRVHLVVGLVRPVGGALRNSAVLLGPSGNVLAIADKCFLWHFDPGWFDPGEPGPVVATPVGDVGMLVCADVRLMEIPGRLSLLGASVLLDPTGLVLAANGTNAQVEYMLAVRARENGAYLAVANRCGAEAGIARYAGRSAIFGPDGERLAEAGPDQPAIIVAEVDASLAPGPAGRDPAGYPLLAEPSERLPIAEVLASQPPSWSLRVGVAAPAARDPLRAVRELGADVAIGPPTEGMSGPLEGGIAWDGRRLASGSVVDAPGGSRVGLLDGDRGLVPEEVRTLMLHGAAVVVWFTGAESPPLDLLRTRADENRICLLAVDDDGRWTAVAPTGAVLGSGPPEGVGVSLVELPIQLS